jgi:hypothetical protein
MPDEDKVVTRTIDWNAEVRKIWGKDWNAPEIEYEFSNGRKFEKRTEDVYDDS